MSIVEPTIRRWSREEYYAMGDLGWFQDQRVELIDGEIIEMAPQRDIHAITIGIVRNTLSNAFGDAVWIREQLPLSIGRQSEPEPDVSICKGKPRDYIGKGHPDSALLVVEVSDTTLKFDQRRKASLYASAGIADYWIVNLVERTVEVRRNPVPDASERFGHRYSDVKSFGPQGRITPLAADSATVLVADLLP